MVGLSLALLSPLTCKPTLAPLVFHIRNCTPQAVGLSTNMWLEMTDQALENNKGLVRAEVTGGAPSLARQALEK